MGKEATQPLRVQLRRGAGCWAILNRDLHLVSENHCLQRRPQTCFQREVCLPGPGRMGCVRVWYVCVCIWWGYVFVCMWCVLFVCAYGGSVCACGMCVHIAIVVVFVHVHVCACGVRRVRTWWWCLCMWCVCTQWWWYVHAWCVVCVHTHVCVRSTLASLERRDECFGGGGRERSA